ncbi:hypothetical protein GGTG_03664 [Gaeumannomyces tritici R3-111a-1]|uniref:Uncharacterized protein n=1 Tax=Gaeumannomyces tritici (strain R3-111a-1) TaxID=644352 RepID=J3NQV8_GAET3|nr:hypothetical protein GGTG_03664 [Gaeumannomyces tritici R3-111a-1]EJT78564.1 hypothetical protein GGTG_03664 [Gaeumannomyces tritici R3-111a-1]
MDRDMFISLARFTTHPVQQLNLDTSRTFPLCVHAIAIHVSISASITAPITGLPAGSALACSDWVDTTADRPSFLDRLATAGRKLPPAVWDLRMPMCVDSVAASFPRLAWVEAAWRVGGRRGEGRTPRGGWPRPSWRSPLDVRAGTFIGRDNIDPDSRFPMRMLV